MQYRLLAPRQSHFAILPAVAAAVLAVAIFVVDSITHPEIAVAPLYAAVVLLVVKILDTRGVLLVAAGCILLSIAGAAMHDHEELSLVAFINLFGSLAAIGVTTYLALWNRSADRALQEQAHLLEVVHDGIIVRNMDDVVAYWNQGAEQLYGWTRDQAVGKISHQLLQTVFPVAFEELKDDMLRTGRWEGEVLHTRRDGIQLTVASRWSLQRDHRGNPVATIETNNDITARKQAEDALKHTQSELAHVSRVTTLGQLVASIAHEVNQPLAAIVANGEAGLRWLGQSTPKLEEARHAIERIIGEGLRASEVIKRLRSLSAKGAAEKSPVNINQIITDVLPLVQREALDHNVSLRFEAMPELPLAVGDRVQLQQVVLNLVMNAIEAMSDVTDRPRRVLIRTLLNEDDQVAVAVRDTGPGISPEDAGRLFNPFFSTKSYGMGMGLSICRSIVEGHDGRIWASQNADHGATLEFVLPACRGDAS
jgi:two-component system, LuxR family, sensor kinase FixL